VTAQREAAERSWCTGEHNGFHPPLHRSPQIRVGPEPVHRGRGQVAAWLEAGGDGPTWVAVLTAHMASTVVELSLEDARLFHRLLGRLIELADRG
jgi:hypothetical protein